MKVRRRRRLSLSLSLSLSCAHPKIVCDVKKVRRVCVHLSLSRTQMEGGRKTDEKHLKTCSGFIFLLAKFRQKREETKN